MRAILMAYHADEEDTKSPNELSMELHACERAFLACLSCVDLLMCDVGRLNGQKGPSTIRSAFQRSGRGLVGTLNAHVHRTCLYILQLAEHVRRQAIELLTTAPVSIGRRVSKRMGLEESERRIAGSSLTNSYAINALRVYESALVFHQPFMEELCCFTNVDASILSFDKIIPLNNSSIRLRAFDYKTSSAGASLMAIIHAFNSTDEESRKKWNALTKPLIEFTSAFSGVHVSDGDFSTLFFIPPIYPTTTQVNEAQRA